MNGCIFTKLVHKVSISAGENSTSTLVRGSGTAPGIIYIHSITTASEAGPTGVHGEDNRDALVVVHAALGARQDLSFGCLVAAGA